jgi:hypothetical protein
VLGRILQDRQRELRHGLRMSSDCRLSIRNHMLEPQH